MGRRRLELSRTRWEVCRRPWGACSCAAVEQRSASPGWKHSCRRTGWVQCLTSYARAVHLQARPSHTSLHTAQASRGKQGLPGQHDPEARLLEEGTQAMGVKGGAAPPPPAATPDAAPGQLCSCGRHSFGRHSCASKAPCAHGLSTSAQARILHCADPYACMQILTGGLRQQAGDGRAQPPVGQHTELHAALALVTGWRQQRRGALSQKYSKLARHSGR